MIRLPLNDNALTDSVKSNSRSMPVRLFTKTAKPDSLERFSHVSPGPYLPGAQLALDKMRLAP